MRTARTTTFIFCLSLMTLAFSAMAADVVVIGSNAPLIKPGQFVTADALLEIPVGARVTLVSESGKTVTLKGPHSGPAGITDESGKGQSLLKSLSGLFGGTGKEIGSFVMREDITQPPSDPWVVDVGRPGNHCVPASGKVKLWRATSTKPTTLSLKNLADKSNSDTSWPAKTNTLDWPSQVTLDGGTEYLAQLQGSRNPKVFVVHLVPADLPSDAHRAVWMAEKGCVAQAKRLLARLR